MAVALLNNAGQFMREDIDRLINEAHTEAQPLLE